MNKKSKRPTALEGFERNARIIVGDQIHAGEANATPELVRTLSRGLTALLDDKLARYHQGKGAGPIAKHVREVMGANPKLRKPREIRLKCDLTIVSADMSVKDFGAYVRRARPAKSALAQTRKPKKI